MNRFDKGSSSVTVYHPETDEEYEIGCYWRYSSCPATLEEPAEEEFSTYAHELISVNGEKRVGEVPEWIDWDEFDREVYEKELGL